MELNAKQLFEKRRMRLAIFGIAIAFVAAVANTVFQNFNVAASGIIAENFTDSLLATYVLSVLIIAIGEIIGGIIMILFNRAKGTPVAEFGRALNVKSSRMILVSAIMGGPIGTACSVMAVSLCGSTYANCVVGLVPAITCVMGAIFLKEKTGVRVWIGVALCTIGVIIAAVSPPEGVTNFYLGIGIACIAPIAFAIENIISTHAVDVVDPMVACPLYRMLGSACMELIIVFVICAATGHLAWIALAFKAIFASPICMLFILCMAVFMCIQYNGTYTGYTYCGAIKASAILWTGTFWTIPVGFTMAAMNILDYNVTAMGIIGAIVVVVGIMLVIAKPSELFSLRSTEEE